jgi:hypothetical protein
VAAQLRSQATEALLPAGWRLGGLHGAGDLTALIVRENLLSHRRGGGTVEGRWEWLIA